MTKQSVWGNQINHINTLLRKKQERHNNKVGCIRSVILQIIGNQLQRFRNMLFYRCGRDTKHFSYFPIFQSFKTAKKKYLARTGREL